jgi:hypothetical protein
VREIIPLISSSVKGPLGVCHLPRLWLKILLHASGRLPEGYRHGAGGFDEMTCTHLGIKAADLVRFVEGRRPTYLECEAWVRDHAKKLSPETIADHNEAILTWEKSANAAAEQRADIGIPDWSLTNSVALNDLDDWMRVYRALEAMRPKFSTRASLPPAAADADADEAEVELEE